MTEKESRILLHVPHSSRRIPSEYAASYLIEDMDAEHIKMTDMYCDELFCDGRTAVVFPYSRLLCDVERFRDDADEEMSAVGMGAMYTKTSDGRILRSPSQRMKAELLRRYYDPHHAALTAAVEEKLSRCGSCLVIDGHSFHPTALPYELHTAATRPDFCIGTDAFHTPKSIETVSLEYFRDMGFDVAVNSPFAGTMVPLKYYGREKAVSSVMIEINRSLYMNENGEKTADFAEIKKLIFGLYSLLE